MPGRQGSQLLAGFECRLAILERLTARMVLEGVDLASLAADTEGYSGADLTALCQQAAIQSMVQT